jgi:glycosyltransferase involved in cell wall biosynthesis
VRRAARVIAVSEHTRRDVLDLLDADPGRVTVVMEAPGATYAPRRRAAFLAAARRLRIDPDTPYVLFVGTLEPRKNLPLLLEAFARVRKSVRARLVIAGAPGWLDADIRATHERLGLGDDAHFLGKLEEDDLAVLYSHAAVLACPSLFEGFGLVPLEAMACGAPVVCSNAGPLPEVVGDAALLLPPDDPGPWAETIERVLSSPPLAADLRARGLTRAAGFSWVRTAEQTRQVYREALGA